MHQHYAGDHPRSTTSTTPTAAPMTTAAAAAAMQPATGTSAVAAVTTVRHISLSAAAASSSSSASSGTAKDDNAKTDRNAAAAVASSGHFGWLVSPVAGACAGALAKTTIAPLDRAKINFQINKDIPYSFRAVTRFLRNIHRAEGFVALYRGNSATMVRIVPYAAIQFTAHERWRRVLAVDEGGQSTSGRRFIAGSLAGVTSQTLTYPLDMMRARMAVSAEPTSLRAVFLGICRTEGPRTLLRGYVATVLGIIPYAGTSFFTYETLKRRYQQWPGEKHNTPLYMLMFGAAAGAIGQTTSYPLDIVRRRMQTEGVVKGAEDQYKTILSSLKNIYRHEGICGGFFKGLSMNWVKGPIAVGVSFSTYDMIKGTLEKQLLVSN